MSQIILDLGSGNTLTDVATGVELINAIIDVDTKKHEVIFKTQLFTDQPPNKPLNFNIFKALYTYAYSCNYKLTSSVFDLSSLQMLLHTTNGKIPFVKIACRPDLYWLIGEVPRKLPVYASWNTKDKESLPYGTSNIKLLYCVPKYPAKLEEYLTQYCEHGYVSDHVKGWGLWEWLEPEVIEKHVVMEHNDTNPDAGPWAATPQDLKEIL